jgi:amino acid adenylation domain-containing protein
MPFLKMNYLLTDTIRNAADRFPEKAAFRLGSDSLTYEELEYRANQVSSVLIEKGVRRGDRIGVFLKPSLETAAAIYGIMKAGGAYVPLDPNSPPGRIAFLLNDCGIKHLISDADQTDALQNVLKEDTPLESIIGIDEELPIQTISREEVSQMPKGDAARLVLEDDLAYVMYTSGTTGVPKGIMHTHRSGLAYAKLSKKLYGVSSEDILGNHSPLHFDISTFGYFTMPLARGTTVIIPEAYKKFPASLSQLIEKENLTIWYSVPLALIQMLQRGILEKRNLENLRWILFGGEPFPAKHLRELMKLLPQAEFSNVYGPAEVNQCTFYNLPEMPEADSPVPLGQAWENTEIIVADENDGEVGKGEVGELLVRTATMMKGYWGQPELTEKAFYKRERIFGCEEIFYRTGDLVRENSNGDLMFMGRRDRQIKFRGYRVELNEIESVLTAHTNVDEAAVYTFKNEADELVIAASVVLKNGSEIKEKALHSHTEKHLPSYATLNKIIFSKDLPRTAAGKIDHRELEKQAKEKFL